MGIFVPQPPDQFTKVDFEKGVTFSWHDWFYRMWKRVDELGRVTATSTTTIIDSGGMMPYYIPAAETFTVPVNKQGLWTIPIVVDGVLVVDGIIAQVD